MKPPLRRCDPFARLRPPASPGGRSRRAHRVLLFLALLLSCVLPACSSAGRELPEIAESYVRLALALEWRDPGYVDAYFGPPAWEEEAAAGELSLAELGARTDSLLRRLAALAPVDGEEALRRRHLALRLRSMRSRIDLLSGAEMSFDEESRALFGAVPAPLSEDSLRPVLAEIEAVLPGEGPPVVRYRALKRKLVVPRDRLDAVLTAALERCRAETLRHLPLPAGERVEIEYVTGRPWLVSHRYLGGYRSVIEVNEGLLLTLDDVLDIACHEAYPGHHTLDVLLERALVGERGWVEHSLLPLYGPHAFVAEGTARFGAAVAFPGEARARFEREVLFPLAGIDPREVEAYPRVRSLVERLAPAVDEGARRFLDGEMDRPAAAAWLEEYALLPDPEATLAFANRYRSYLATYRTGEAVVRRIVEGRGGTVENPARRWEAFGELLSAAATLPPGGPFGLSPPAAARRED